MTPYISRKVRLNDSDQIELSEESLAMMEEIPDLEFINSSDENLDEMDYPIIRELLNLPRSDELNLNLDNTIGQLISGNMARRSGDILDENPDHHNQTHHP